MPKHRIFTTAFSSVYSHYVAKAERKGRTQADVDEIIRWLTGYSQDDLEAHSSPGTAFEGLFSQAPAMHPRRDLVTGVVCGVRVEAVEDHLMREIRRLDKLVDELAKGRPMAKILRATALS